MLTDSERYNRERYEAAEEFNRKKTLLKYCSENNITPTPGVHLSSAETQVSVVIPAFNEEDFIGDTVLSLGTSDIPIEIIVVDNGSDDDTKSVVLDAARQISQPVTILDSVLKGPVFARKRGMDELTAQYLQRGTFSKKRYIAMTDADTTVPSDWARAIVTTFQSTNSSALGGRYKYPEKLDQIIEEATGVKDYFGYLPKIANFLASQGASTITTSGANAAIEIVPYAEIGGSQQPRDEQGNVVKGNDMRFGNEVRKLGQKVAFLPIMTTTNARREIFSMSQKTDQRVFSTMKGWVNCREQDVALLESIAGDLNVEDLLRHRHERGQRFVLRTLLLPVMRKEIAIDGLSQILGEDDELIKLLYSSIDALVGKTDLEVLEVAQKISEDSSSLFLSKVEEAMANF